MCTLVNSAARTRCEVCDALPPLPISLPGSVLPSAPTLSSVSAVAAPAATHTEIGSADGPAEPQEPVSAAQRILAPTEARILAPAEARILAPAEARILAPAEAMLQRPSSSSSFHDYAASHSSLFSPLPNSFPLSSSPSATITTAADEEEEEEEEEQGEEGRFAELTEEEEEDDEEEDEELKQALQLSLQRSSLQLSLALASSASATASTTATAAAATTTTTTTAATTTTAPASSATTTTATAATNTITTSPTAASGNAAAASTSTTSSSSISSSFYFSSACTSSSSSSPYSSSVAPLSSACSVVDVAQCDQPGGCDQYCQKFVASLDMWSSVCRCGHSLTYHRQHCSAAPQSLSGSAPDRWVLPQELLDGPLAHWLGASELKVVLELDAFVHAAVSAGLERLSFRLSRPASASLSATAGGLLSAGEQEVQQEEEEEREEGEEIFGRSTALLEWSCPDCTFYNPAEVSECAICLGARPTSSLLASAVSRLPSQSVPVVPSAQPAVSSTAANVALSSSTMAQQQSAAAVQSSSLPAGPSEGLVLSSSQLQQAAAAPDSSWNAQSAVAYVDAQVDSITSRLDSMRSMLTDARLGVTEAAVAPSSLSSTTSSSSSSSSSPSSSSLSSTTSSSSSSSSPSSSLSSSSSTSFSSSSAPAVSLQVVAGGEGERMRKGQLLSWPSRFSRLPELHTLLLLSLATPSSPLHAVLQPLAPDRTAALRKNLRGSGANGTLHGMFWPRAVRSRLFGKLLAATADRSVQNTHTVHVTRPTAVYPLVPSIEERCRPWLQFTQQLQKVDPRDLRHNAGVSGVVLDFKISSNSGVDRPAGSAGPFREGVSLVSEALGWLAEDATQRARSIFVKTPNARSQDGFYQDKLLVNPAVQSSEALQYDCRLLGWLMGICVRSHAALNLDLHPVVWQLLLHGPGPFLSQGVEGALSLLMQFDQVMARLLSQLEAMGPEEFEGWQLKYVCPLSDATEVELLEGGANRSVRFQDRLRWRDLVLARRVEEAWVPIENIREGLLEVIPPCGQLSLLELVTWAELEARICGMPEFPISALKEITKFRGEQGNETPVVGFLWRLLESYSLKQRKNWLRFVVNRTRLPSREENFDIVVELLPPSRSAPRGSTCTRTLRLPAYDTYAMLEDRMNEALESLDYQGLIG
eukprot:gb/GEZN01000525.1/.p1 GENE.gb/GEZN01000525.1/~~gb/GEZN01000525.1/.p1  ORF type:complete len:1351 (+),score=418.69 gb/GEZN01000525.1/:584-4054(+)